jgi:hypothetical protein
MAVLDIAAPADLAVGDRAAPPDLAVGDRAVGADGAATCMLGSRSCDPQLGCIDDWGCNWCGCTVYGTPTPNGQAACNLVACIRGGIPDSGVPDGGFSLTPAPSCRAPADCPSGQLCLFDPGCTLQGRCVAKDFCLNSYGVGNPVVGVSLEFCGCDGTTASAVISCAMGQPYRHLGACP